MNLTFQPATPGERVEGRWLWRWHHNGSWRYGTASDYVGREGDEHSTLSLDALESAESQPDARDAPWPRHLDNLERTAMRAACNDMRLERDEAVRERTALEQKLSIAEHRHADAESECARLRAELEKAKGLWQPPDISKMDTDYSKSTPAAPLAAVERPETMDVPWSTRYSDKWRTPLAEWFALGEAERLYAIDLESQRLALEARCGELERERDYFRSAWLNTQAQRDEFDLEARDLRTELRALKESAPAAQAEEWEEISYLEHLQFNSASPDCPVHRSTYYPGGKVICEKRIRAPEPSATETKVRPYQGPFDSSQPGYPVYVFDGSLITVRDGVVSVVANLDDLMKRLAALESAKGWAKPKATLETASTNTCTKKSNLGQCYLPNGHMGECIHVNAYNTGSPA